MTVQKQTKRVYKKIDARTVAIHQAKVLELGNGASVVRALEPEYKDEYSRASKIARKSKSVNVAEYIEDALEQMGEGAIQRVNELIYSTDERIATKNAHYAIDHIRGKAISRNINVSAKLNIQSVLD